MPGVLAHNLFHRVGDSRTGVDVLRDVSLEAPAGKVTFVFTNDAPVPHNFAIKDGVTDGPTDTISGGATAKLSVTLPAGTYEFYCAVPGHEQAGMKGTLTVK